MKPASQARPTRFRLGAIALLACCVQSMGLMSAARAQDVAHHTHAIPPHRTIIVPQVRHVPHPDRPIRLASVSAHVAVNEQVAATRLTLALHNPSSRVQEAEVVLPVPDGALVRSLEYDGTGPEPNAKVLPRDEARRIYDSIVRSMRDPALVEFAGYNLIRTSVFPIQPGQTQHVRLTYELVLPADGPRVDYLLPRSESLAEGAAAWTIEGTIRSTRPISTLYSPSHELSVTRSGPGSLSFRVATRDGADRGSIRLSWLQAKSDGLAATMLFYPDPDVSKSGEGGYFLLLAAPPATGTRPTMKREVVIVLDRSGSMRGEKMDQARAGAEQILAGLDDGEFFNIIDYSDSIASFADKPVVKDAASLAKAKAYLADLRAQGGTNIGDALAEALRSEPAPGTLPIVLFLTDGLPTVGERNEVRLRDAVAGANSRHKRRIFTFGVGHDVNSPLLSHIATRSRGASTFVQPREDVEVAVSQVFRRLAGPVLASPRLELDNAGPGRRLREVMPATLPDIFDGDQLVVLGEYACNPGQPLRLTIRGECADKEAWHQFDAKPDGASVRHAYVGRLWAYAKVGALIDEIRQAGAAGGTGDARMKELTDEIIRLSTKWGILTEYTAFLATEEAGFDNPTRRDQVGAAVRQTLRERAEGARVGGGAISQESNLGVMNAPATPMATKAAGYVDKDQNQVEVKRVAQLADSCFFQRNNRWVEARLLEMEAQAPDRTIEFASDEYIALMNDLAKEGRQNVLAQTGEIYLLVKKQRVLVKGP